MKNIVIPLACLVWLPMSADVMFVENFAQRLVDPSMTKRMENHWSSCEYVCGNGTINPLAYSSTYGKYRYSPELPYFCPAIPPMIQPS